MIKMVSRVRDISILWISAVRSSVPRTPAPLKLLSPKFQLQLELAVQGIIKPKNISPPKNALLKKKLEPPPTVSQLAATKDD